jgi:putative ABC transport system substrate-binding protein
MHELGYVEGKNIKLELRGADGNPTRLPQIATELVRLPVEVIVTGGPQSTSAAKRADPKVAVVMTNDTDRLGPE